MRDSYSVKNAQNVAQGPSAKAITKDSTIHIGKTHSEKAKQVNSLTELEVMVNEAVLPVDVKETVLRHLRNAREEIVECTDPNPIEVGKWLERADTTLKLAGAAAGVVEKFNQVVALFWPAGG